ncbi:ABC transporter permease [Paenibacillus albiflavus]|nr:ABC transporter permease subunit [Paenibacillus albiflavus]
MKKMKNMTLWIGVCMLAIIIIVMIFGPYFPHVDATLEGSRSKWGADGKIMVPKYPPSESNLLGSDGIGVDNFSKLILGTRDTIYIIFGIAIIRYLVAIPLGLLSYRNRGYFHFLTTFWNQIFSYLPTIFSVAIIFTLPFISNNISPTRLIWAVLIVALIEVGRAAYVIQQQTSKVSNEQYVEAGHALGLSPWRMIKSYYMPALLPEMIIYFCIDLGKITLLIGQMGVLKIIIKVNKAIWDAGMGIRNGSIDWVSLLSDYDLRRNIYVSNFDFVLYPAAAIMFTILTFNILGEGLRQYFNRRGNSRTI